MSATPRPWEGQLAQVWGADEVILRATEQDDPVTTWDNVELTVRAVNAFDALLAVAKAADHAAGLTVQLDRDLHDAQKALDAAHPDWRSW